MKSHGLTLTQSPLTRFFAQFRPSRDRLVLPYCWQVNVVETAVLLSTRGTAGPDIWFRSWSIGQWSEATSVGLCLKASKAESRLDHQRYRVRPASGWSKLCMTRDLFSARSPGGARMWTRAEGTRERPDKQLQPLPSLVENTQMLMCRTESFADDLRTGQGVVGGRAASSLRSAKTSP